MKRRRRQKETFFSLLYKSIRPYLSHSLSLLPLLLLFYIYAHTHAQNTRQKVCPSVHPEERVVLVRKRMFLRIRVKKMQKSFCSSSSFKIWSSLLSPCTEKKKISFLCCLVLEKKNLFGDEMNAPRSSLFTQHLITMAASSLTAAALGSKVAFANKVRFMSATTRCVDSFFRVLSFIVAVLCARALRTEGYE